MTLRPRLLASSLLVFLVLLVSSPALAQAGASAELKKRGDALFDERKFAEALELYEKAYAAHPTPALLYNEARALEAMGEYPDALAKLEEFKSVASAALVAKVQGLDTLLEGLRKRVSTVTVRCNVDSAELFIRGKALGAIARARTVATRAGSAEIEVRAEGYEPARRTVVLDGGGKMTVELELVAKQPTGLLVVGVTPKATEVVLDGKPIGLSPLETRVPRGSHVVVLRHDGYKDERVPLTIGANERRVVDVELSEHRPFFGRWYVWTGIAAIVAGGVVAAALLIEGPAEKGTFNPGQQRAPLTIGF